MGSSEPLYIIDGAKVQSGPGGLLFLDPNEIKRIEVLKDIGSTAVYGSEGANGVVIITTKRAR
jgi:TonB-dependent SusC/RagA subfamily outer membrane receptor